jgi:hypothetical protein
MAHPETLHWCSPCGSETFHEVVVFEDGFGDESERACVDCGAAIVVGVGLLEATPVAVPLAA